MIKSMIHCKNRNSRPIVFLNVMINRKHLISNSKSFLSLKIISKPSIEYFIMLSTSVNSSQNMSFDFMCNQHSKPRFREDCTFANKQSASFPGHTIGNHTLFDFHFPILELIFVKNLLEPFRSFFMINIQILVLESMWF